MIPAEAVESAAKAIPAGASIDKEDVLAILEAAAPHLIAAHLDELAVDVKARGDIGKHEGLESWDYLAWKAERLRSRN